MPQLSRKIPYIGTEITPAQSRVDIENLLNEVGIKDTRWTNVSGESMLEFVWRFEEKGLKKSVSFKIKPPVIQIKQRKEKDSRGQYRKGEFVYRRAESAEWRLTWWWLKAKLEAVQFGLETMEQALMSQVLISLPNGQSTTIGEIISQAIKTDTVQALKSLPGLSEIIPTSEWNKPKQLIEISENGEVVGETNN